MSMPVISAMQAQQLNQKVQQNIDSHLFLFCNYEPTISYAISEDGLFLTAVQDLYKFGIDSNCILKSYRDFVPSQDHVRFDRLKEILDFVSTFRAVTDHNQSAQNGKLEQMRLDRYQAWLQETLHKPQPETQQDFKELNDALKKIADDLVRWVDAFIQAAKANPDRNSVVQTWTARTLHWYCSNTKTEIYKGQLMDAYLAKATEAGNDYPDLHQVRALRRKINRWIEAALLAPYNAKLDDLSQRINSAKGKLDKSSPMVYAFRAKMTPEQFQAFEEAFSEELNTLLAQYESAQEELNEFRARVDRNYENYVDFFFENLQEQLRKTSNRLNQTGESYTLLPQDLIQADIEDFFGCVPSPDEDF